LIGHDKLLQGFVDFNKNLKIIQLIFGKKSDGLKANDFIENKYFPTPRREEICKLQETAKNHKLKFWRHLT